MNLLLSKTRFWFSLIRFIPYETDTPEGRSKERLRRVALTAIVSAIAYGINILTSLVSVPLTLNYLGTERYGLWVSMSSLIIVLGFADLGLGNGLLNAITEANGRSDVKAAKSYVSSAFFMLVAVALIFAMVWVVIYPRVSWSWLFNVSSPQAIAELGPALSIFVLCMLVNLPLSLIQKIQDGYQQGYLNGIWRAVGSLLGLAGVLLAISFQAGLPALVMAMAGAPLVALLINSLLLFGRQRAWLRPRWRMFNQAAFIRIFKNGMLFFVLQLAVAIGFQSDYLVIAHYLGSDQVPQYSVPMRLFMFIPAILGFVIAPLWPAYGEAIARKDATWVTKTFKRSLFLSFCLSVPLSIFLVLFGDTIIKLWVGSEIQPETILLVGLGLWVILLSFGNPISMLLNAANVITFQVICASLMVLGNIAFSIFLVQRLGVSGPVFGSITSWMIFSLLPSMFFIPRLFASWQNIRIST